MLAVKLKPGERIVVNGAVLRNGESRTVLYFANNAKVLREKDVIQEEEATGPASRVYYIVQLMLLNPEDHDQYQMAFERLMTGLLRAIRMPSKRDDLLACIHWVGEKKFYKALSVLRRILDHEAALLPNFESERLRA